MDLKTENRSKNNIIGFVLRGKVDRLVRVIPKEHLVGLDKIVIVDEIPNKRKKILEEFTIRNRIISHAQLNYL